MPTEVAFPVFDVQGEHTKVDAGDDRLPAFWAEGAVALVAGDVADVDVLQPLFVGYAGRRFQGLDRSGGQVGQLVGWREAGEVEGHLVPQVVATMPISKQ